MVFVPEVPAKSGRAPDSAAGSAKRSDGPQSGEVDPWRVDAQPVANDIIGLCRRLPFPRPNSAPAALIVPCSRPALRLAPSLAIAIRLSYLLSYRPTSTANSLLCITVHYSGIRLVFYHLQPCCELVGSLGSRPILDLQPRQPATHPTQPGCSIRMTTVSWHAPT